MEFLREKTDILHDGGALSGASDAVTFVADDGLLLVVQAWQSLTDAQKQEVIRAIASPTPSGSLDGGGMAFRGPVATHHHDNGA